MTDKVNKSIRLHNYGGYEGWWSGQNTDSWAAAEFPGIAGWYSFTGISGYTLPYYIHDQVFIVHVETFEGEQSTVFRVWVYILTLRTHTWIHTNTGILICSSYVDNYKTEFEGWALRLE